MRPLIWYEFPVDDANRQRLETVADVVIGGSVMDVRPPFAVVIGSVIPANGEFMDRLGPQLRVIARPGIGVDNVDLDAATQRGIPVIHTPDAPTESTAEHAVALLMAVAKRVVTGTRFLETNAAFPRAEMFGTELRDRVLGVVGMGRIGRRVAEICALGLKMRVLAYDPFLGELEIPGIEFTADLDDLLARADMVTLHVPLTPHTRRLIGADQLHRMKRGSYLVNAARGPVVDEQALIRALQEGHLAGAALDVFDPEPPAPDNPLLRMNNVVCTPHIASYTERGAYAMRTGIVDQLLQLLSGERPRYIVNPDAWPGRFAQGA
ncbi:MAG: hydroxyacid dehydrogenase [Chloroflexi bacterium]|nr:MAG: hydroxyacid dehydrogenase [Chloroflexota bacterium]